MESQILRLDSPYNLICDYTGAFALHIATLIVPYTKTTKRHGTNKEEFAVRSYPIVSNGISMDGEVWAHSEYKNCRVVCRTNEPMSLYILKKVMEFCVNKGESTLIERIPIFLSLALMRYDIKFLLPTNSEGNTIHEYEVGLIFDEYTDEKTCIVHSEHDSDFFFYAAFSKDKGKYPYNLEEVDALDSLANLRDSYLNMFGLNEVKSITFTTLDKKYQSFIDRLNDYEVINEQRV